MFVRSFGYAQDDIEQDDIEQDDIEQDDIGQGDIAKGGIIVGFSSRSPLLLHCVKTMA
jgi:hypothetical protein